MLLKIEVFLAVLMLFKSCTHRTSMEIYSVPSFISLNSDPAKLSRKQQGQATLREGELGWRQAGPWQGCSPTVAEQEEQRSSSGGNKAQLTDQTTRQAFGDETVQDQDRISSDHVRIRAKRLEGRRLSTSRDWEQEPELRSSSTAKVDRTTTYSFFSHHSFLGTPLAPGHRAAWSQWWAWALGR